MQRLSLSELGIYRSLGTTEIIWPLFTTRNVLSQLESGTNIISGSLLSGRDESNPALILAAWAGNIYVACVATVSIPFPGGEIEQASEQAGERRSTPEGAKSWAEAGSVLPRRGRGKKKSILTFRTRSQFVPFECFFWKRLLRSLSKMALLRSYPLDRDYPLSSARKISHDICTRLIPPTARKIKNLGKSEFWGNENVG